MITNILFLSCAYSEQQKAKFLTNSKRGYQFAAQNFQESLISGFRSLEGVQFHVLSIPALSTFPMGNRYPYIKDCPFIYNKNIIGKSFGFVNLPIMNHFYQKRIDRYIDMWVSQTQSDKCIVVYAMLKQQMKYAIEAKKRHPDIKLCLIIPDLPIYMNCNKYYKMLGLQERDIRTIYESLYLFDSYVVLSDPMTSCLHIDKKPYVVVEGIYNEIEGWKETKEKLPYVTLMYAGGIQTRYGVFELIEAFHRIEDSTCRLILCGPCPEIEKLNMYLAMDSRIEYKGLLSTSEVRRLLSAVTLLINPRRANEDFTKYSFPSKTLEYMASGTPLLMYNLPSMPQEYKQYVYLFDDESSIDDLSQKIQSVVSLDADVLCRRGQAARDFVIKCKNPRIQTLRILSMIKELFVS